MDHVSYNVGSVCSLPAHLSDAPWVLPQVNNRPIRKYTYSRSVSYSFFQNYRETVTGTDLFLIDPKTWPWRRRPFMDITKEKGSLAADGGRA